MTIEAICDQLRAALFDRGFEYGFFANGRIYKPDMTAGFDGEYARCAETIYRIQPPKITLQHKIGTCVDAVLVMKSMLDAMQVPCKIWLQHHRESGKVHTITTFTAQGKTVYLELTPRSSKPWYGQALVYAGEQDFLQEFAKNGYELSDVTDRVVAGQQPFFLLDKRNG